MNYLMRLLGAFFLANSFLNPSLAEEFNADYRLISSIENKQQFVVVNNSSTVFPIEVIDQAEKALRFSSVDSEIIPLVSLLISILSFGCAIFVPIYLNWSNNKKSVLDDFWARQVFYPDYLKPLLDYSQWLRFNVNENFDEKKSEELNHLDSQFLSKLIQLKTLADALKVEFDQNSLNCMHREMQDYVAKYINLLICGEIVIKNRGHEKIIDKSNLSLDSQNKLLAGYKNKVDELTKKIFNEFIKIMTNMQKLN